MAVAAAVLTAVTSVVGGLAAYQQGKYQQQVAQMNSEIAQDNAKRAIDRSQVEAQSQDAETLAMLGEQVAAQGASGLNIQSKSFSAARANARTLGRQDALNIRQAGELEAYNFKTDAANFDAQGQAAKAQGAVGLLTGFMEAGSGLAGSSAFRTSLTSLRNKVASPRKFGGRSLAE